MTALHYSKIVPQSAAATTAAAGYPASDLLLEALGRPWRSTALAANTVDLTLAAAVAIQSLVLHDVNFATATIQKSADGGVFNPVGVMNTYCSRRGRYRGIITINDPAVKVVRVITPGAGPALDGAAFWRAGFAALFASKLVLPFGPEYTYTVRTKMPKLSAELPNGLPAVATTGLDIDRILVSFKRNDNESFDALVQKAAAGTCAFDMELANYPEQVWPVRLIDTDLTEDFTNPRRSVLQATLTEAIAAY